MPARGGYTARARGARRGRASWRASAATKPAVLHRCGSSDEAARIASSIVTLLAVILRRRWWPPSASVAWSAWRSPPATVRRMDICAADTRHAYAAKSGGRNSPLPVSVLLHVSTMPRRVHAVLACGFRYGALRAQPRYHTDPSEHKT